MVRNDDVVNTGGWAHCRRRGGVVLLLKYTKKS